MDAEYNDVQEWLYKDVVKTFGAKEGTYKTFQIRTKDEVRKLFADKTFNATECFQFVEVHMPKEDAPRALKLTAEASAKRNAKQ